MLQFPQLQKCEDSDRIHLIKKVPSDNLFHTSKSLRMMSGPQQAFFVPREIQKMYYSFIIPTIRPATKPDSLESTTERHLCTVCKTEEEKPLLPSRHDK